MNKSLLILVFEVAGERHGLAASAIREVLAAVPLVRVDAGSALEGVINLRGRIVPVLDIRRCLGLPAKPVEYTDHLIVSEAGQRLIAIRVDRTIELAAVPERDFARDVAAGLGGTAFVAKLHDGLVVDQDLGALLLEMAPVGGEGDASASSGSAA